MGSLALAGVKVVISLVNCICLVTSDCLLPRSSRKSAGDLAGDRRPNLFPRRRAQRRGGRRPPIAMCPPPLYFTRGQDWLASCAGPDTLPMWARAARSVLPALAARSVLAAAARPRGPLSPSLLLRQQRWLSSGSGSSSGSRGSGGGGGSSSSHSPYQTLGLPADATIEQVKLAYYQLAMKHHPDRSEAPDAADRFAEIGAAYDMIMGLPERSARTSNTSKAEGPRHAAFAAAFPPWVYRAYEYLQRVPQRLDTWLEPSWSSIIYQHLRKNELAEALQVHACIHAFMSSQRRCRCMHAFMHS